MHQVNNPSVPSAETRVVARWRLRPRVADRGLDRLARVHLTVFGRDHLAFRVCGVAGLIVAILQSLALAWARELSLWIVALLGCAAVAAFLVLAMGKKILTGEESLTYYHHQFAVLGVTAVVLWLLNRPIPPYLDIATVAVGAFLAFGRVGCLMAGCCHGRPSLRGIRYWRAHVLEGLPPCYEGVPLFPVQLAESWYVAATVAVCDVLLLGGAGEGVATTAYLAAYAAGRFLFELLRGDTGRRHVCGLSEAQWTSALILGAIAVLQATGRLQGLTWTAAAGAVLLLATLCFHWVRPLTAKQLRSVAEAVRAPSYAGAVLSLPGGLRISVSMLPRDSEWRTIQTFSRAGKKLDARTARHLAGFWLASDPNTRYAELREGNQGVFHLLLAG